MSRRDDVRKTRANRYRELAGWLLDQLARDTRVASAALVELERLTAIDQWTEADHASYQKHADRVAGLEKRYWQR